ncbi:glycerol-3-phosphate cytidyltransferase [Deferribacter desulfuricans SSM1]|uniref:D-glycero-beta-D-manno-heptose 1-phosphate adenylyltransferase n=1 Tax=Deferribacter desulfuricans (strain DSM 14783 / JCM 11476 / NBRC 101012 / SSM1) TaxID=639282 RepID=D3PAW6_DEFDS|nr:D-glycero-beta-D-manno-heptose 1-phosphate adenylyltransferase [Deferribacter desulfuricans]BAI79739.1 glycerol-3-phosphate cytidyltransferase [Deferribacter desulfuricans SSM1]
MENIIFDVDKLVNIIDRKGKKVVFTNGCFDIVHYGHISYLYKAKELGDILVVALNSDESVKRLKGEKRPINSLKERAALIASLKPVDYVTMFEEDTPYNIIKKIKPDVLVKGGDWKEDEIVGSDIVKSYGGEVYSLNFVEGFATTNIIEKIIDLYCK